MAAKEHHPAAQGAPPQANQVSDAQLPPLFPTGLSFRHLSLLNCHCIQLASQPGNLSNASQEAILNSLALSTPSTYLSDWDCFKAYNAMYQLLFPSLDITRNPTSAISMRMLTPCTKYGPSPSRPT